MAGNSRAIIMEHQVGMRQMMKDINRYDKATQDAINKAIQNGAINISGRAKDLADQRGHSGNLAKGITYDFEYRGRVAKAVVKATAEHSYINEFGTAPRFAHSYARVHKGAMSRGEMPERPFLQPAVSAFDNSIVTEIEAAVKKGGK